MSKKYQPKIILSAAAVAVLMAGASASWVGKPGSGGTAELLTDHCVNRIRR